MLQRKLGRPTAARLSMLKGLVSELIMKEKITTTYEKAKEVQRLADKMVTFGKKATLASRRQADRYITIEDALTKLFDTLAPRYAERAGGYTRVIKIGQRRGDAAEMAVIEFVA